MENAFVRFARLYPAFSRLSDGARAARLSVS